MDHIIHAVIVMCFAILFAVAAWHKLRNIATFRSTLDDYQLLPPSLVRPLSVAIPCIEIMIAVAILSPVARALGLIAAGLCLAVYASAIAINIVRGRRDIDCGCAGPAIKQPLNLALVARNALLALFAALGLIEPVARPLSSADILLIVLAATATTVLYAAANRLIASRDLIREMAT